MMNDREDEASDDESNASTRHRKRRGEAESPPSPPKLEQDERFPSGPWTGFFLQKLGSGRHWMELNLTFHLGTVKGDGRDWVGLFVITGRYATEDGTCRMVKHYVGKHDVAYEGYNEGRGIWGLWKIDRPALHGGFHIWPVGMPDPTRTLLAEEADLPAPAGILEGSEFATTESELPTGVLVCPE